jgi:hypothetical protein
LSGMPPSSLTEYELRDLRGADGFSLHALRAIQLLFQRTQRRPEFSLLEGGR